MFKTSKGPFSNCTRSIRTIRRIFARIVIIRYSQLRIAGLADTSSACHAPVAFLGDGVDEFGGDAYVLTGWVRMGPRMC